MHFREILKCTTLADRILFSAVMLLSLLFLVFLRSFLPANASVEITVGGKLEYVLSLDEDQFLPVQGLHGKTLVEIRNRRVRVTESPCQNKLCVRQGWVEHGVIACLPNRVIITVGNAGEKGSTPDAVTE